MKNLLSKQVTYLKNMIRQVETKHRIAAGKSLILDIEML